MRGLVKILILLALLWSGWWWIAANGMKSVILAQADTLRAEGWQIDLQDPATSGFPLDLQQDFDAIRLTDPDGTTLDVPPFSASAKAYWPGIATVDLPTAPIVLSAQGASLLFTFSDASADLRLAPDPALTLESFAFTSGPWQVNDGPGVLLAANSIGSTLTKVPDTPRSYGFTFNATDLVPGPLIRDRLNAPINAPLKLDASQADGTVRLDQPLDRHLIGGIAAVPEALTLSDAQVSWGDISLSADADLSFDPKGIPEGTMTAVLQNWQGLLSSMRTAGIITQGQETSTAGMLALMATLSGTGDALELRLLAQNGQLNLNGIALGAAPALFAR